MAKMDIINAGDAHTLYAEYQDQRRSYLSGEMARIAVPMSNKVGMLLLGTAAAAFDVRLVSTWGWNMVLQGPPNLISMFAIFCAISSALFISIPLCEWLVPGTQRKKLQEKARTIKGAFGNEVEWVKAPDAQAWQPRSLQLIPRVKALPAS